MAQRGVGGDRRQTLAGADHGRGEDRRRGQEGKDGNPLNEVRMIADSLLLNDGVLTANSTIKYNPAKAVLGLRIGDAITLTRADFERLAAAFFAEMHAKFGQ